MDIEIISDKWKRDEKDLIDFLKKYQSTRKPLYLRTLLEEDEEQEYNEEDYNVSVYQILPYPPNTKNPRDSFIERT